ncbi:hypothetical protein HGG76_21300 [Ochrobactrum tritici]|uniref:Uncharacterized protein n=1 Tax=Brucella tritici TaxID=94626 RepID=A0A7X6FRS6_9HYPH|nr:hypothetical protein [Brucella tritici]
MVVRQQACIIHRKAQPISIYSFYERNFVGQHTTGDRRRIASNSDNTFFVITFDQY